ncbi:chorismate synthase [Ferroplasma sp.]|uniref:chorismate synthase n=1 Tax=Ferroplasma sp. TaxID=2591003 RepID=UPI00261F398B|nr:chorismate synthase [Ferroplasma sp.]MCL4452903.1 chorismate synthase [Candidatus Thermoplasmatota archaeon]
MFSLGNEIRLTVFGSSHGPYIGGTVDGLPAGTEINKEYIQKWLDRRRPGQSLITTQRNEEDAIEIIAGSRDGFSDGSPFTFLFKNKDYIDKHYDELKNNPRPGHADLTMFYKYGDFRNYEGGGFFSGRMTLPLVAAGALAMSILDGYGIKIVTYIKSAGDISMKSEPPSGPEDVYGYRTRMPDRGMDELLYNKILKIIKEGDSLGSIIKTSVYNVPPGVGEPFFNSVESEISRAMFSIPGLKGVEFGAGFNLGSMMGSEANDEFYTDGKKIMTRTNNSGGILGGITDGMPVEFSVAMKPTSSIRIPQKSVNITTMEPSEVRVTGRHDPFISFRAVPVIQTLTAFVILDLMMAGKKL